MTTSDGLHRLFVYGTLKRGQPNEYVMTSRAHGAVFVGESVTVEKYPLIIGPPWNLPFLLNVPSTGKHVQGEVYDVDDDTLHSLDEFEGHPHDYKRSLIDVHLTNAAGQDKLTQCWVYMATNHTDDDLCQPHLDTYHSEGSHGRKYDTSENVHHPEKLQESS